MLKAFISVEKRPLIRRYLLWCFKTTKEDLERIDRKFTQLEVDNYLLQQLPGKVAHGQLVDQKHIDDFKQYMAGKKTDAERLKFEEKPRGRLQPDYVYLQKRLDSVEKAIVAFLGKKELAAIRKLYETEMTKRILEAREHK